MEFIVSRSEHPIEPSSIADPVVQLQELELSLVAGGCGEVIVG